MFVYKKTCKLDKKQYMMWVQKEQIVEYTEFMASCQ